MSLKLPRCSTTFSFQDSLTTSLYGKAIFDSLLENLKFFNLLSPSMLVALTKNHVLIYINLSLLKQAADDAMQSYKGKSVLQATWYHTLGYARIHFACSSNFQG